MKARPTVAVVGLGLIGGSLARALTRAGYRVVGVDRLAIRRRAKAAGAVAEAVATVERAAARADVVVLAAPPEANLRLIRKLARVGRSGLVVTDVGSVKAPIQREARRLRLRHFVGGHPMAGAATSGFGASSARLFRGRPWILTGGTPTSRRRVGALARAVGARPVAMDPADHDRALAFLSHVPQIVAWALLDAARRDRVASQHLAVAGPGFRDMTRLAASPRGLWREILAQNRIDVARALAALRRDLHLPTRSEQDQNRGFPNARLKTRRSLR